MAAARSGCATALAACITFAAAGASAEVSIAVVGDPEVVFDWSGEACVASHAPDAPARAFRRADGSVALIASHNDNRMFFGPALDRLVPDCTVVFEASRSSDLEEFDDLSWISGLYTSDGITVHALAHTELRGHRTPGQCPNNTYSACLLNTVTALVSHDGGESFEAVDGGPAVVATLPYRFPTDRDRRVGYANPTNIVRLGDWYYAMVFADGYRDQRRGMCLIRTRSLEDPGSWRAWDGSGFTVRFADPFREAVPAPGRHVCRPVSPGRIGRMIGSLSVHSPSGQILALFGDRRRDSDGRIVSGIYLSTSKDLVTWSEPELVMPARLLWEKACGRYSLFYPSLIDPGASSRSFEDVEGDAYLFLVRFNLSGCRATWDRDLLRIPVRIAITP